MPPVNELESAITMRAFEIEQIASIDDDYALDIKVLSNRAFDCLSHIGLAREISAIFDLKFKEPEINKTKKDKKSNFADGGSQGEKIEDLLEVEIKNREFCSRYGAKMIIDVEVGESPDWLKNFLRVCGLRPINNIVDIVNFVMLESGQPMHAFDYDKLQVGADKKKIIIRNANNGEKIITLDNQEKELDSNILVIADEKQPIAIAGIKGGKNPEIDENTKRVVLEAANFNFLNIRRSSRQLGLRTDASWRFENGVNINLILWSLNRAVDLINELAVGRAISGIINVGDEDRDSWQISLSHNYTESLLGIKLTSAQILDIFRRLRFSVKQLDEVDDVFYEITIPVYRQDLLSPEDLIEEIGRIYGYENISPQMPSGILIPSFKDIDLVYADKVKDILAGLGYLEVYNYSFISESDKENYNLSQLAEIANPLSQEQKYLRPFLASGLINNLSQNIKYLLPASGFAPRDGAIRIFEIGHVFEQANDSFVERKRLGGLVYLDKPILNHGAFYELKGVLEILFNKLGISAVWDDDSVKDGLPLNLRGIMNFSKTAQIKVGDDLVGWIGELNSKSLEGVNFMDSYLKDKKMKETPVFFELDFDKLITLADEEHIYRPPFKFPAVIRDLAVLVDREVKIESVLNVIEIAGGELLVDVDIFDIYENDSKGGGKNKSAAFHLIFQSEEKNLSDIEINKLMGKIIKAVEERDWEVRK